MPNSQGRYSPFKFLLVVKPSLLAVYPSISLHSSASAPKDLRLLSQILPVFATVALSCTHMQVQKTEKDFLVVGAACHSFKFAEVNMTMLHVQVPAKFQI